MSRRFRIFGLMMMIYPESKGLGDDDDDDDDDDDGDNDEAEESRKYCNSEHPSPSSKSSDSSDDNQTEDLEEPIPFFLASRYMVKHKPVWLARHALEHEEEDQEFQKPFYKDVRTSNLAEDEESSLPYHRPERQRLPALPTANAEANGSHDFLQHGSGQDSGSEASASTAPASDNSVGHPESTRGAKPHMLHKEAGEDRESQSLQPAYDMLRKENSMLLLENKRLKNGNLGLMSENFALKELFDKLRQDSAVLMKEGVTLREEYNELRKQYGRLGSENAELRKDNASVRRMFDAFRHKLERQTFMVSSLQNQLKTSQDERERETRELQSLVQQTECHLQLMTRRALDAEINVERLKQKIFILQGQLERFKLGNENWRADWPGSSEAQHRLHQEKPPRAHNGHKWLPQAASASGALPVVAEVLESSRKVLKF